MRRPFAWIAASALALCVAGIAGEGFVRVSPRFADLRDGWPRSSDAEAASDRAATGWRMDPFRGWALRTGSVATPLRREADHYLAGREMPPYMARSLVANAHGFSSPIADYREVPTDDFAVGLFGGSVAWMVAVMAGDVFERALEARFPELAGRVVLLNFASGGYKQPQPLAALAEAVALGVPLDLVIELDGFNEVIYGDQNARLGHHPLFPARSLYALAVDLDAGLPSRHGLLLTERRLREQMAAERIAAFFDARPWLAHSRLLRVLALARIRTHERRGTALEQELQRQRLAGGGGPFDRLPDACLGRAGQCFALIAELWQRASRMMAAIAARGGAGYLHALQPNPYVEGSKPLAAEERERLTRADLRETLAAGHPALQRAGAALRRDGIAFHDLTDVFAEHRGPLYVDECCHVSLEGSEILARELVARIGSVRPLR